MPLDRMKQARAEMIVDRDSGEVLKNRGNYKIECVDRVMVFTPEIHSIMGDISRHISEFLDNVENWPTLCKTVKRDGHVYELSVEIRELPIDVFFEGAEEI